MTIEQVIEPFKGMIKNVVINGFIKVGYTTKELNTEVKAYNVLINDNVVTIHIITK